MASASPARQRIKWMWKSNVDSFSPSEMPEWNSYSDVETAIIEEAHAQNLPEALLDDYHINFKQSVQICNQNADKQRPVKRVMVIDNEQQQEAQLREERFMPVPVLPSAPFTTPHRRGEGFLSVALLHFHIYDGIPLAATRQMLVEKAAEGLIVEGKLVSKQKEGEWMSQQLLEVKQGTEENVWQCCARLYCLESFLYKKLNEYMRLSGDEQHEALWRSRIPTLGPFAILLWHMNRDQILGVRQTTTVYRGADLPVDLIERYRVHHQAHPVGHDTTLNTINDPKWIEFPAFTSTSRNRAKAEQFGNVLFIMEIGRFSGFDVSPHSNYDEEEILLKANYIFAIRSCVFDEIKDKWVIDLA